MTDLVLRDIDPILAERLRRIAAARGWSEEAVLLDLLEQGLYIREQEVSGGFDTSEVDALSAAIKALQAIPPGSGL